MARRRKPWDCVPNLDEDALVAAMERMKEQRAALAAEAEAEGYPTDMLVKRCGHCGGFMYHGSKYGSLTFRCHDNCKGWNDTMQAHIRNGIRF